MPSRPLVGAAVSSGSTRSTRLTAAARPTAALGEFPDGRRANARQEQGVVPKPIAKRLAMDVAARRRRA